ncbi:MAG: hypothetical protein U9O94_03710 [Nanoarchaeota archaeon]|nr:hypothetical protein [Nanoarchaeota archaeon]
MKKGQGLSLNTIIIAAIVLIVLVVLWAIFTGRMGVFSQGLTDITRDKTCEESGGVIKSGDSCGDGFTPIFGKYTNVQTGEICCKPTGTCEGGATCSAFKSEATCPTNTCTWVPATA